ncbi:MAG: helix-turn-helix domain-containing protein [Candidatus Omnitrophica bacterium]|nr:helix-turn-helix domain-containing protein [Candidatus Omnitrophota bacterium]
MADSQYISVRETAQLLGVSEKKIMDMIEDKTLHGYRIANQFLRLKKKEVLQLQSTGTVERETNDYPYTFAERITDFFYFNDFYLISVIIILILLYIIFYK